MKKGSPKSESKNSKKVTNELKLNVDEQHDAIKHLKEYFDIEPPWKDKAVYKTCTKKIWLENHIQEKYTKLLWNYCGQIYK